MKILLDHIDCLNQFLDLTSVSIEIITTPSNAIPDEEKIRDIKDRPILRAAQTSNVDILLTGDKDFLESDIRNPKIMSPAEFIVM